jgi:all-trans-retinol 13,14-reductase
MDRLRSLERDRFDAIVVGGGIGGLTAAAILARHGQSVLVLDQQSVAGGNATIFRRRAYEFDVGLHYVGDCGEGGLLPRLLRCAGVDDVRFREMDRDGFETYVFPGLTFRVPASLDLFRERLLAVAPREVRGVDRYLRYLREVWSLVPLVVRPTLAGGLARLPRARLALRHAFATLGELFDACGLGPELRAILAGQSNDYGLPPSQVSASYHALMVMHYALGAYYPEGGGQVLSDRLAAAIEAAGGTILLASLVTRIVVEGGAVQGVTIRSHDLGERTVRAPLVISNADFRRTVLELVGPDHFPRATVQSVRRSVMGPALSVLFVVVDRDLVREGVPNSNYWWFPDFDTEAQYREVEHGRFATHAYLSFATLKDPENPRIAPRGQTNFQVMTVVPADLAAWGTTAGAASSGEYRQSAAYLAAKERLAEQLLAAAERVFPGIARAVVFREVATPVTHARYTASTGGSAYGLALVPSQVLHHRSTARTAVRGLLVCGASQRYGHGIFGAMLNGMAAASCVVGKQILAEVTDG